MAGMPAMQEQLLAWGKWLTATPSNAGAIAGMGQMADRYAKQCRSNCWHGANG
jgi:hypothetical protein